MTELTQPLPKAILSALEGGPKSRRELEMLTGEPNLIKQLSVMRGLGALTTIGQKRGTKYALPDAENND
jgi:hypothetical protein